MLYESMASEFSSAVNNLFLSLLERVANYNEVCELCFIIVDVLCAVEHLSAILYLYFLCVSVSIPHR